MYKISLAAVNVPDETYPMMEEALKAGKIGQTDLIEQFEATIAQFTGALFCIAVSNGTMADAVAVAAMKEIRGCNLKHAIVPALTFIAQPNSVLYNGLDVIFADVKENWMMDLSKIDGKDLKSSIVFGTDLMGRQCFEDMDIEDACEAFGSKFNGYYSGRLGKIGTYSFFPSHTISTGEGGMIVTDDERLAILCRSIRAHGVASSDPMNKFHFPHFGFNARLTSIQAVLGICLMKHIDEYILRRCQAFDFMKTFLGGFNERSQEEIVPHGYPVEFESEETRDAGMQKLIKAGIECRKFFSCIPLEEFVYLRKGSYPVAQHISHTHLYLPCHQNLTLEDIGEMCTLVLDLPGIVKKPIQ